MSWIDDIFGTGADWAVPDFEWGSLEPAFDDPTFGTLPDFTGVDVDWGAISDLAASGADLDTLFLDTETGEIVDGSMIGLDPTGQTEDPLPPSNLSHSISDHLRDIDAGTPPAPFTGLTADPDSITSGPGWLSGLGRLLGALGNGLGGMDGGLAGRGVSPAAPTVGGGFQAMGLPAGSTLGGGLGAMTYASQSPASVGGFSPLGFSPADSPAMTPATGGGFSPVDAARMMGVEIPQGPGVQIPTMGGIQALTPPTPAPFAPMSVPFMPPQAPPGPSRQRLTGLQRLALEG